MTSDEIMISFMALSPTDKQKVFSLIKANMEVTTADEAAEWVKLCNTIIGKALASNQLSVSLYASPKEKITKHAPTLIAFLQSRQVGAVTRTHLITAITRFFEAAVEYNKKRNIPISHRTLVDAMAKPEEILDDSYPGYLASGMLGKILGVS